MRMGLVFVCLLIASFSAFGQAGTGTITGTVTDPAGAVVAGAAVQVKNTETGVVYPAVTTNTGNYTVTQLPVGTYEVTVRVTGFKTYTHTNIQVQAASTVREDPVLVVGAAGESVTVTAESSLLKTETGDLAHNITLDQLDNLPILGIGGANAGSSGVRNPFNSTVLIPGVDYAANFVMIVNGAPSNTAAYRVEGLDNTNHTVNYALQENQPSADAIQEVAVQTSNYAAEYGTAGGGLFNITMKSGTNQYHGSAYEYFVNEDLNAAYPFTRDNNGHKVRPRNRRNDYGGTMGGPIIIPKIYNGRNRTFFFFNFEEYQESNGYTPNLTLPIAAFRMGDFSSISPNGTCSLCDALGIPRGPLGTPTPSLDGLGRPIYANTIYDPATRKINPANGIAYADPFPGNMILPNRFDPVAVKIQSLIPNPTNGSLTANGVGFNLLSRVTDIPSVKLDQSIGTKGHLSFYWSTTGTDAQYSVPNGNADGLPDIISTNRGTFIHSLTERLNYDHTLTPTLLMHFGAGYSRIRFFDDGAFKDFNCLADIGLQGCQANYYFPTINGLIETGTGAALGGMQQMGNAQAHTHTNTERPSANANATWVKGSHTYKAGAEVWFQGQITAPPSGVTMTFSSATNQGATALPFNPPNGLSGQSIGFPYANFLLGDAVSISQTAPQDVRMGKSQWAIFVQDSWKANRKLTLDYGLRWDYATAAREQYGRSADFSPTTPNPSAGGRPGAWIYEATCHCTFVSNYPYAIGPRLGIAYQITPKTVLRAGWGFVYGFAPDIAASSANVITNTPTGPNSFINIESPGALPQPVWPNLNPGVYPLPGQTGSALAALDRHASRPPRQNQWSVGIQRELTRNLVLEASYVANRGVWWTGPLGLLNQVSPDVYAAYGLHPYTNPADNLLLSQTITTTAVTQRVGLLTPYSGYPTTSTLNNALRPFPQFGTANFVVTNSPTGKTWYDSLQAKMTKRFSHGLQANGTFTWSKAFVFTREDFWNPQSSAKQIQATDQPFLLNGNVTYTTPGVEFLNRYRHVNWVVKDWQLGAFLQYGSGLPLTPPNATTTNNLGTSQMFRVPGQPLYLKDLNCGCINPYVDQVLNPNAWANPPAGTFGPLTLYSDFRQARRPQENFNIGRNFRVRERMNLQIRAEFANIFNRTQIGNPITANPRNATNPNGAAPAADPLGRYTAGFGVINDAVALGQSPGAVPSISANGIVGMLYQQPRSGTLIARFTF